MGYNKNKSGQSDYVCEVCWNEQDHPGNCDCCLLKGAENSVSDTDLLAAGVAETMANGITDAPIALFDEYPVNDDNDPNITYLDPIQLEQYVDGEAPSTDYFTEGGYNDFTSQEYWKTNYGPQKSNSPIQTTKVPTGVVTTDGKTTSFTPNKSTIVGPKPTVFTGNTTTKWKSKSKNPPRKVRTWRSNSYWFIGDVHDDVDDYYACIKSIREIDPDAVTVQLGDWGNCSPEAKYLDPKDLFIFGNHDNDSEKYNDHPNFLGRYGYKHGLFYVSGARANNQNFLGEELSHDEMDHCLELYKAILPEIVVSHDCPDFLRKNAFMKKDDTDTTNLLQSMWDEHNPHVWMFGHYHRHYNDNIDGCEFTCINELEAQQIRLGWVNGNREDHKHYYQNKPTAGTNLGSIIAAGKNMVGNVLKSGK